MTLTNLDIHLQTHVLYILDQPVLQNKLYCFFKKKPKIYSISNTFEGKVASFSFLAVPIVSLTEVSPLCAVGLFHYYFFVWWCSSQFWKDDELHNNVCDLKRKVFFICEFSEGTNSEDWHHHWRMWVVLQSFGQIFLIFINFSGDKRSNSSLHHWKRLPFRLMYFCYLYEMCFWILYQLLVWNERIL